MHPLARRFTITLPFPLILLTLLHLAPASAQTHPQPATHATNQTSSQTASHATPQPAQPAPLGPEFYVSQVKPIFDAQCARCHLNGNHRGGLNMDTRQAMLKGGRDGTVLIPGDPQHSLLVQLIRHEGPPDDPMPMPPARPKLTDQNIATVTQWVKSGAPMP